MEKETIYFWSSYGGEWGKWLDYKLVQEKGTTNLLILFSIFTDVCKLKNSTAEEFRSPQNKEKFFAYLLPLLEQGKLKVKIRDLVIRVATEKELIEGAKMQGKPSIENFMAWRSNKDHINLHPKHAINMIRERWNAITSADERSEFEEWAVLFTLPENDWAM